MRKMHTDKAAKQKAYRDRKRNARKPTVTPIGSNAKRVTVAKLPATNHHLMLLSTTGNQSHYAWVLCGCSECVKAELEFPAGDAAQAEALIDFKGDRIIFHPRNYIGLYP